MRFTLSSAAALLALVGSALAQTAGFDAITSPAKDQDVSAGSTFQIVWTPDAKHSGTVTISLLGGSSPNTLQPLSTIKSGVESSAGKYDWAVSPSLGSDSTYGIKITLDSDKSIFQYSFPFHITGGGKSSGSSSSGYPTSTASYNTTSTSASTYTTLSPSSNLSTTATTSTHAVLTLTSTAGSGSSSKTASSSSAVSTSGAGNAPQAGSFVALFGGVLAAVLAL